MAFIDSLHEKDGLVIKPDGPFYAHLLWDYLKTTVYKWECNMSKTVFLIEAFEYSPPELFVLLSDELQSQNILVDLELNEM